MEGTQLRRVFSIMLVILIYIWVFGGCKKNSDNGTSANLNTTAGNNKNPSANVYLKLEDYTEELKITAYLAGGCDAPISNEDCLLNKYFKEEFNINMDDVTWPMGEDRENKINIMASSGDIPDVINFSSEGIDIFRRLANANLIMPLDDLIDEYMPNFKDYNDPSVLDIYRNEKDDKLYVLPSFTVPADRVEELVKVDYVPFVRRDILKKTGMNSIDTLNDLYDFLKASKQIEKDIIPMSLVDYESFAILFGMDPYKCEIDHNSQRILNRWYLDEYLEAMKFLAKLFREQLLDQEIYTTKREYCIEKVKDGKVAFCFGNVGWGQFWFNPALKAKYPDDPDKVFDVIKMPRKEGINKTNYWTYSPYGSVITCISKKTKDPVRLAKFIDWSFTDYGNTVVWFGAPSKEGGYWYEEDGKIIYNDTIVKKITDGELLNNSGTWSYWLVNRGMLDSSKLKNIAIGYRESEKDLLADLAQELNKGDIYTDIKFERFLLSEKGAIAKEKNANIQAIYNKWEADIVMRSETDREVEQKYKEMIMELEKAGCIDVEKEDYQIYMKIND